MAEEGSVGEVDGWREGEREEEDDDDAKEESTRGGSGGISTLGENEKRVYTLSTEREEGGKRREERWRGVRECDGLELKLSPKTGKRETSEGEGDLARPPFRLR